MAEGLDISFGCVATKVTWGDDGVSVSCEDGRSFSADAVIVTVSLGVLKVRISSGPSTALM
jgi:glycine/D-amino acid oxidase-like deaminating enzyme